MGWQAPAMVGAEVQRDLFPGPRVPAGTTVINDRCLLRTEHDFRIVLVSGIVLLQYTTDDRMAEAYAVVSLVQQGWADQMVVARAFGCSVRSVRRYQRRFEAGGLPALGRAGGYPARRPRLPRSREQLVRRLKAQGLATRAIAALCDKLNTRPVLFPGSLLCLRYGIALRPAKRTISRTPISGDLESGSMSQEIWGSHLDLRVRTPSFQALGMVVYVVVRPSSHIPVTSTLEHSPMSFGPSHSRVPCHTYHKHLLPSPETLLNSPPC